ncbi:hypothetical protein HAX54_017876 [Datura stramonium]|uniref:Uncharacterized protein n=1 Tax=Datura stramonium TaxID=4076 RepID=A0ABS8UP96_DATST|nr:hypothetical protein [Datura stramonium]
MRRVVFIEDIETKTVKANVVSVRSTELRKHEIGLVCDQSKEDRKSGHYEESKITTSRYEEFNITVSHYENSLSPHAHPLPKITTIAAAVCRSNLADQFSGVTRGTTMSTSAVSVPGKEINVEGCGKNECPLTQMEVLMAPFTHATVVSYVNFHQEPNAGMLR